MASLSEAYGCTFSETPFEVIDENFNIEEKIQEQERVQERQEQVVREQVVREQERQRQCPYCKESREQKEMTNLLLLIVIGLLLFIIIEKRMK